MMDKYRATLKAAAQDRDALLEQRSQLLDEQELVADRLEETDKQIKRLEETILSLSRLCGVELATMRTLRSMSSLGRYGLTQAIREAMKSETAWVTAMDVRRRMLENKFDDGKYDNLLANIHVTLKRLAKSGELLSAEVEGKTAYKINPDFEPKIERMGMPTVRRRMYDDLK